MSNFMNEKLLDKLSLNKHVLIKQANLLEDRIYNLSSILQNQFIENLVDAIRKDLTLVKWEDIIDSPIKITNEDLYLQMMNDSVMYDTLKLLNQYNLNDDGSIHANDILEYVKEHYEVREHFYNILKDIKNNYRFSMNEVLKQKRINLQDLQNELNDKIDDVYVLDGKIDWGKRDGCFLYINGEIIYGDEDDIHQDLLRKYLRKYHIDIPEFNERMRTIGDTKVLSEETDSFATGHIINDNAFIEICENCSINDVKNALLKDSKVNKIYQYDRLDSKSYILRMARR